MSISGLSAFYNNLLTIQVTVFGIIAAAIFVLVQISHSTFNGRHSLRLLRDRYLIAYLISTGIALVLTAIASLMLSLDRHDFVSSFNFQSRAILVNIWTPAALLFLTGLSVMIFICFVVLNLAYLHPHRVLLLSAQGITPEQVRLFLFHEYGLDPPIQTARLIPGALIWHALPVGEDEPEDSSTHTEQLHQEIIDTQRSYRKDIDHYNELRLAETNVTDPLDIAYAVTIRAVQNMDFHTLKEVNRTIDSLSKSIVGSIRNDREKGWNPDLQVARRWAQHVTTFVSAVLEVVEKQGMNSVSSTVLQITDDLWPHLAEREEFGALFVVMSYWKRVADNAIGKNKAVFTWIVKRYESVGSFALEQGYGDMLDRSLGDLGWLGERVLEKIGLETKPKMYDVEYSTEYEDLLNVLLSFGSLYSDKYPTGYPLICFDSLMVIAFKLVELRRTDSKNNTLKDHLDACTSKIWSFIEPALRVGNSEGAALAVMRLVSCYKKYLDSGLKDSSGYTISLLAQSAADAAVFEDKSSKNSLLHESIEEYISKVLEKSPFRFEIAAAVREALTKSHGPGHAKVWGFVKSFGRRMGSNFGFMFDWETGQIYSEDDPRRR